MISRELAEKLKDSGLRWEPTRGDWFGDGKHDRVIGDVIILTNIRDEIKKYGVWLPSLSQLLAEIEKRGYGWIIEKVVSEKAYDLTLIKETGWGLGEKYFSNADTPLEEAVGQALLWILKEGGSNA